MNRILTALLLASLSGSAFPKPLISAKTSAGDLRVCINAEGGKKVISELWADVRVFEALLDPVEAGDPEWLEVWSTLRPYSDGAAAESIDISFARAIPKAPEAVLRLVGHGLELKNICGSPFIEPDPGVAEEYKRKALAALSAVRAPELISLAKECSTHVKIQH